mgnify:CR=1 FL=1
MRHGPFTALLAAAGLMAAATSPARADAIDGDWCSDDGKRLTINGPDIVTPAGQQLKGDYDRHHFSYVEPGGSAPVRRKISVRLKIHGS